MPESDLPPVSIFPGGSRDDRAAEAASLIRRMSHQDSLALGELHRLWGATLLGIACRILGDRREAEEAVQDTFVKLWHRSADYDSAQSPPFVWAFSLLRGYCIDRLRYRHRLKRDSSRVVPLHLHSPPEETQDPQVIALDEYHKVKKAMSHLEQDERDCLELAVFLEYTHSEISEQLGTPLGTVKNRIRRALDKIRNHLSHYEI